MPQHNINSEVVYPVIVMLKRNLRRCELVPKLCLGTHIREAPLRISKQSFDEMRSKAGALEREQRVSLERGHADLGPATRRRPSGGRRERTDGVTARRKRVT